MVRYRETSTSCSCRAEKADELRNCHFDLAVNTWSLGEMPDAEIARWFALIEKNTTVDYMFLLNHFLSPVPANPAAVRQATTDRNWLIAIGRRWRIDHVEFDPAIHRSPMLRSQFLGLALLACRVDEAELEELQAEAAAVASALHNHQWVRMSLASNMPEDGTPDQKRRSFMNAGTHGISDATPFVLDQITRNLNIWRPDLEAGSDSAFFRLWNDIRLNAAPVSTRLLRIWLHLQWRQALQLPDGQPANTLFREEIAYAGDLKPDPLLRLPDWMAECFTAARDHS